MNRKSDSAVCGVAALLPPEIDVARPVHVRKALRSTFVQAPRLHGRAGNWSVRCRGERAGCVAPPSYLHC